MIRPTAQPLGMKRRLLNLLTLLSLLLCVAVGVLWVLSYNWYPDMEWGGEIDPSFGWPHLHKHQFSVFEGRLGYILSHGPMVTVPPSVRASEAEFVGVTITRGYWWMVPDSDVTAYRCMVTVPLGWLLLVSAVLPAFALWSQLRERHRTRRGRCTACGYDLTGNVSGVCPECGEAACR
jgi:hypothetical protein